MIGLAMILIALGPPQHAWQLGLCGDRGCTRIGPPQPLEICTAMRDAMLKEGQKRVVCAKVLVDNMVQQ